MLASLTLLVVMNGPVTDHREFKDQSKATAAPRLRGAVRVGANQDPSGGRQEICLALSGGTRWSIESCGTGAGFLAPASPAPDLAHFRIRYQAWSRALESGWLIAGVQAGFAELEWRGRSWLPFHLRGTPRFGNGGPFSRGIHPLGASSKLRTLSPCRDQRQSSVLSPCARACAPPIHLATKPQPKPRLGLLKDPLWG